MLKYRESDYFNSKDIFIYRTNLNKLFLTKVVYINGSWFSQVVLQEKMSSVECINFKEIKDMEVSLANTELKGKIVNYLTPLNIGISWNQGQDFYKQGLPYYWNNINNFNLWQ